MPRPQLDDTSLDFSKMGAETSSAQHELMTGEQSPTMPEGLDDDDHAGRARGSSTALSHHPTDGFLGSGHLSLSVVQKIGVLPPSTVSPNRKIFEARKRETAALGAGEKLVLGHPLAATIGDSARCMQNLEKVLFTGPKTSDTVTFICD